MTIKKILKIASTEKNAQDIEKLLENKEFYSCLLKIVSPGTAILLIHILEIINLDIRKYRGIT